MRPLCRSLCLLLGLLAQVSLAADERLEALEEQAFREAAALAEPSIVRIETVGGLDFVDGLLTPTGPTTGIIVGEEGWIITSSFNFASRPASILVMTPGGARYPAIVVAGDASRRLTLLKIEAAGLTPIVPAPQENLRVGQWAIALGRTYEQPFPNISVGIISAMGRIWGKALQTDAKVSPMNYGGPLVDLQGRAMGVLVPLDPQKSDETAGVQWYDSGIGFAIPMEDIYAVLGRLQSGEDLQPGRMGVHFKDQGPTAGEPVLERVRAGSPAYEAGLRPGDRITQVNGRPVNRVPHVKQIVGRMYAGEAVAIAYVRNDAESIAEFMLAATLEAYEAPLLGILPERLTLRDTSTGGAAVRFVLPATSADKSGLKRRDIITAVDGQPVTDASELQEQINHHRPGDSLELTLIRGGDEQKLTVTLGAMDAHVPDELPSVAIPARAPGDAETEAKTGRWIDTLGGDNERSYWAFIPDDYNPEVAYGLVVWLHPAGDTKEAEVLQAWQRSCNRRGIIMIGPKTSQPSGWTPEDVDFVADLVEDIRERYTIDPLRITVQGYGDAARMAAAVAFRERETVRGLSLLGAALRIPPPETHPEHPLQIHLACGRDDPEFEAVETTAEDLRELKFPVTLSEIPDLSHAYPSADVIDVIARWVDALDRI